MTAEDKSPLAKWLDRMEERAEWIEWAEKIGNIAYEGLERQFGERFREIDEEQMSQKALQQSTE